MKRASVALLPALAALGLAVTVSAAQAGPIGTSENFETQTLGAFPTGWLDVAAIDPTPPNPPLPSAIVVSTTDAHGNPTRALATNDFIAPSQGIYRIVPHSSVYTSKADIR